MYPYEVLTAAYLTMLKGLMDNDRVEKQYCRKAV